MMSPAGVDEQGRFLGNIWHVIHTALWNPLNVHRILGNMAFGGGVVAAYAAYKFLASKTDEDRAHYDWMGYIAMALGVAFLIPLPFAGYWLMREVYAYRQQMGITLMGGLLAWLFIIQATMIGILFLSTNYYLWQAMGRMRGAEKYQRYIKYLVFLLVCGFLVFITPHTMVMSPAELKAMGGQQHPVLGNYGVMSAKNGGINVIITTTVLSFVWYMRGQQGFHRIVGEVRKHLHGLFLLLRLCQHHLAGDLRVLHSGQRPRRAFRSPGGDHPVLPLLHVCPE